MGDAPLTAAEPVQCGACSHTNPSGTRFCEGCGHTLYEACANCGKSVVLTQKFCGACGEDLEQVVASNHEQHEAWMVEAVAAAKEYDFDLAITLLARISSLNDYRYQEAATGANEAIGKIETMRERASASAQEMLARAKEELDKENPQGVVRLLENIPAKLMNEDTKRILKQAKAFTSEVAELELSIQDGITKKNWPLVGGLIGQLLSHAPNDEKYLQIARQVSGKLIAEAKGYFAKRRYLRAVQRLEAVPDAAKQDDFDRLHQNYEDVLWLSQQFDVEPYVTPMLGRLSVRYAKEVPDDSAAAGLVQKLADRLKQGERTPRNPFPGWEATDDCWMGGQVALLGYPVSVDIGEQKLLKSCGARFHIAIGLALQGLGQARVKEHFAPKKGLFKSLSWRKKKPLWGIDIGSASLKAVCLQEGEDGIKVVDSYYDEFANSSCRGANEPDQKTEVIEAAIAKFADEKEIGDTPVWTNVPASDLVNRFVRLPPVGEKQAAALLTTEIEQKIPIPMEDLAVVRWMGGLDAENVHGRPALISAAKRAVVEQRFEMLTEAGLKIAGFQGDPIAVVNFAAYEFGDLISPEKESGEDNKVVVGGDKSESMPTIALLESGAKATSMILVSSEAHWFWTLETGGEDLTSALARSTKSTHAEAEKLKRNPAALTMPSRQYKSVAQRMDETRSRLEKAFADATSQNTRFDVVQSWCMGGGCLAHQWMRRMMLEKQNA